MKRKSLLIRLFVLIGILLSACGPSQAELDATATQAAMDIFDTQTAQAPTATATFTVTPQPTDTATPTATSPPTETPKPTETPTLTPTPTPAMMVIAPTVDDLPAGFVEMTQESLGAAQISMPQGIYFGFGDETKSQFIMGFLMPVNAAEQEACDQMQHTLLEPIVAGLYSGADFQTLTGLDDIGEARAGSSSVGQVANLAMRYDSVSVCRGEVTAFLIIGYPDDDESAVPINDFARFMDERIMVYLASVNLGGGGRIAFSSNRDGDYEIYIMDPDGSSLTRLTHQPTDDLNPEFSPDGEILIFWAMDLEADPLISEFQFVGVDGEHMGTLVSGLEYASWSPDGNAVVYVAIAGPENTEIMKGVFGQMTERLTTDPASDHMPAWSPDGKTIAFVAERDGMPKIYLMNPDGTQQRRITETDIVEIDPAWSPDGTKLAFSSGDNTSTQIYIMNPDGTEIIQLTDSPGYNEHPTWSPDGTMLAFWSNRTGNSDIYKINIDGSGLINLTNDPAADENPSWSK